ncbi:hypothetical protein [Verminephrobacter eiseniae]|uniref:hypothetical protein n=1 Tax=Verminephrobacter eiseniae TaxID=364317 RepID=UPI002237DAC3|nr:hypothetical protein [Verminephrobacter eiseniae]MCW5233082.1 hypothetical protein [Verminephrobacter eiseniae]MCW5261243.1 hypothetical protein [Verminephrobacter eiseniae]MCW8233417.1 hypothetical protein [Verminephrobacter eiseniae]
MTPAAGSGRRRVVGATVLALLGAPISAQAQTAAQSPRALREMQIHRVAQLGLEIWVENQPAWETRLSTTPHGHPCFEAQSPDSYFPPAVLTYASWPKERVPQEQLLPIATTAIRQASQNFGWNPGQSRGLHPVAASHGVLQGFEADFPGQADGQPLDVKVFVGQTPGRFPVVAWVYTQRKRMEQLREVLRRSWGKLKYLDA